MKLSHSSTSTFNSCPYAWKLSRVDKLGKIEVGPESVYSTWGAAGHSALMLYYQGKPIKECIDRFLENYPNDLDPDNMAWTREGGTRMLEAYEIRYGEDLETWRVLETELADRVVLSDEGEESNVIIDLIAQHRPSGSIYFWDHKFKAKFDQRSWRRYDIDAQISRYSLYVAQRYGDCAGCQMNVIVPGYRQRAYKDEPAGFHFKFERQVVTRTRQQLEYFQESQRDWERLIQHCQDTGCWPKSLGYSCGFCEFYELCVSANDSEVVNTLYEVKSEIEVADDQG